MEPVIKPCRHTGFHCRLCQQTLRYSVFRRHQDLPHLYCPRPGYVSSMDSTQRDSDSYTLVFDILSTISSPANDSTDNQLKCNPVSSLDQALSSESESQSSYDSAPEVWDETNTSISEVKLTLNLMILTKQHQ